MQSRFRPDKNATNPANRDRFAILARTSQLGRKSPARDEIRSVQRRYRREKERRRHSDRASPANGTSGPPIGSGRLQAAVSRLRLGRPNVWEIRYDEREIRADETAISLGYRLRPEIFVVTVSAPRRPRPLPAWMERFCL